jgi:hypothetical protein
MWTKPRETMRRIVFYNPKHDVHLLATLDGFVSYLTVVLFGFIGLLLVLNLSAEEAILVDYDLNILGSFSLAALAVAIGACAIVGPIGGLIYLYLYGWLFRITGRWLGGNAYPTEVRAAVAWSAVPRLWWGATFLVLQLILTGYVLYANSANLYVSTSALLGTLIVFGLGATIVAIWSSVILIKCLGEVHTFSAWRAFGAVLITGIIVYVVNQIIGCLCNAVGNAFALSLLESFGNGS